MNDQVNRDAASVVPTSESVDGGSGSTPCSFSAINYEGLRFDAAIAELILSSSKPVLDTLDSVMFEMVSKLPKDTNFEMWDEISDVFIRYRKSR